MTPKRSQIFRAVARGESIARIADSCGASYSEVWSHFSRVIAELERKNSPAPDTIRFQQYLVLMQIVDQALAAFDQSTEGNVVETTTRIIQSRDESGRLGVTDGEITRIIRKGSGDVQYLEVAIRALREIRELWGVGTDAESRLIARRPRFGFERDGASPPRATMGGRVEW